MSCASLIAKKVITELTSLFAVGIQRKNAAQLVG